MFSNNNKALLNISLYILLAIASFPENFFKYIRKRLNLKQKSSAAVHRIAAKCRRLETLCESISSGKKEL